jgi:hypothetical protein
LTALLPSPQTIAPVRVVRLATAAGALGLVLMGAIVIPLYLVPALALLLVGGAGVETLFGRPAWLPVPAPVPVRSS